MGKEAKLNENIPLGYIWDFCTSKFFELAFGMWKFKCLRMVYVHRTAVIKCPQLMKFGKNLRISRYAYIDALSTDGVNVGDNVSIGMYTEIIATGTLLGDLGKGIRIGNNVALGTHGFWGCAGDIEIGDDTIMGNYVSAHAENHNFNRLDCPIKEQGVNHKGIKIGKGCWVGSKSTFLDGAEIGDGVVVAAGAMVRGVFPSNCVIGGIPARILKYRG